MIKKLSEVNKTITVEQLYIKIDAINADRLKALYSADEVN